MKEPKNNTGIPFSLTSHAQEREWIREANITYGGLIGLGLVMIQPFIYRGQFVGLPAKICVVSFAISTPILAALLLLNREEEFRKHMTKSGIVAVGRSIAQLAAVTGFVAGLWHISPLAGKAAIASCIFAMSAHSAGYVKLYALKNKK
ncbi:MAG: hypothetical protein ACQR33_02070 [Candidatus Saccharibacteria bacterium]